MIQHYKNLIHNLMTQNNKLQAINATIQETKEQNAKNDIIKIKNKYFKE